MQKAHPEVIALGIVQIPGLGPGILQQDIRRIGIQGCEDLTVLQKLCPVAEIALAVGGDGGLQPGQGGSGDKNIRNVAFRADIQPDFPVDAAEGQVVYHTAKGRGGRIFGGIQPDRNQIGFSETNRLGDFHPEAGIASAMGSQFFAVYIHGGNVGSTVKLQKQPLLPVFQGDLQRLAVAAEHLVAFRVGVVQGHGLHIMGNIHQGEAAFTLGEVFRPGRGKLPAKT